MMRQKNYHIFRVLTVAWMLIWGGLLSEAAAYTPVTPPSAWQTTPTLSQDNYPTYQFRSTSAYTPIVGERTYISSAYSSAAVGKPRKSKSSWDEDEDPDGPAIGEVLPIGDPLILLLLAVAYLFYRRKKRLA